MVTDLRANQLKIEKSQCDKSCLMVVFHAQFFVDI